MVKARRIAILQTGQAPAALRPIHGDYGDMSAKLVRGDDQTRIFAAFDGHLPSDPDEFEAYVITGSRFGVNDGLDWIEALKAFVRRALARERKMIGLCFGHQLMADALGGSVRRHPGGPGIGIMEYRSNGPPASGTIALPAWHFDQVGQVPPGARVTLSSDFCPVAGLAFGDNAITFQAHPEFSTAYLSDLIAYYGVEKLGPEIAAAAERTIDRPADQDRVSAFLQRHLDQ